MSTPTRRDVADALTAEHAAALRVQAMVAALAEPSRVDLGDGWHIETAVEIVGGYGDCAINPGPVERQLVVRARLHNGKHLGRPPASAALAFAGHLAAIEAWERGEGPWPTP